MKYDIVVVGGGHAGIEAAYIATKKNIKVLLITGHLDFIGQMSCNPSIGGIAKGNLVREIDSLGGVMAKIIDKTGIHFKMLNKSKGIAVWGNRAQANKEEYRKYARNLLEENKLINIIQSYVVEIKTKNNKVTGVVLDSGYEIKCKTIIVATGTFLNGLAHIGLNSFPSGRIGEPPSIKFTECLNNLGIKSGRMKTGTSPRLDGKTIDYSKFEEQNGDDDPWPFSFSTKFKIKNKVSCYIGKTNKITHEIIKESYDRSPLFTGKIKSVGPRYCPSIEDKIHRFGEREGHTLFLEPECEKKKEIYINGISTSLPFDVQVKIVNSIKGLEKTKILRPGYGIEYDYFPPLQLKRTLESKIIDNLYFAGQINGTSGYEEAAAQGLIAGINATQKILDENEIILGRETSYIGVLIDDLVTRGVDEPYRMFTSRAEYRLLLRQDNCDERLMPIAKKHGFLEKKEFVRREKIWKKKEKLKEHLKKTKLKIKNESKKVSDLIKRPDYSIFDFYQIDEKIKKYNKEILYSVEADIKYRGFEEKEKKRIDTIKKLENTLLPDEIDYMKIEGMLFESRQRMNKIRPRTLGQASRIYGITPADISTLVIYIQQHK